MRASSHRNTAHKRAGGPLEQSAEDSSPLEMRQGSRWQEKGWLRNRCLQQKPIQLKWTCSAKQPKWLLHQTFWRSSEFRNLSNTRQTQTEEQKKTTKKPLMETFLKVQFSQQPTPLHTALTHICVFCLHLGHGSSRCRMSNTTPVALHSELATGFCLSDLLFKNQEACVVLCACVHMYALCAPHAS